MTTHVRCGSLFTGNEDTARKAQTLAIDDAGRISWVGATDAAPAPASGDSVLSRNSTRSSHTCMPPSPLLANSLVAHEMPAPPKS